MMQIRWQKVHTDPPTSTNDQVAIELSLARTQKLALQNETREVAHRNRHQQRANRTRDRAQPELPNSREVQKSSHSIVVKSMVLSPESYRRRVPKDDNSDNFHFTTGLLMNPDYVLLPVVKSEQSKNVFDFYVNSYATSIIEISPTNVQSYASTIHQILHDELLFTACTTTSEAARWRTQSLYADPPLSVVRGYGKTIQLLQQRLQSRPFAMTTIAIMVMAQLTAIESLIKNASASARHLAGLNMVMKIRSGTPPSASSDGLQTAVDVWSEYFMFRETITKTIPKFDPLTYPRHPFDPDLSMQVASLPSGFNDVVLSGRVSTEMLDLMKRFAEYYQTLADMNTRGIEHSREKTTLIVQTAGYCFEYVQIQSLTLIERFILVALTAYVVRRDRMLPFLTNTRNYFQICCANLSNLMNSPDGGLGREDLESDLIKWVGVLLLLTSSPEAHARKLALRILPKRPEPMAVLKKCQQFFWDEDLTNAFLSGGTLISNSSNDIVTEHVEQDLAATRTEDGDEKLEPEYTVSTATGSEIRYGALLNRKYPSAT